MKTILIYKGSQIAGKPIKYPQDTFMTVLKDLLYANFARICWIWMLIAIIRLSNSPYAKYK